MATARTPRRAWIDEGLRVLTEAGADAVAVEVLAKRLGVTKGGFYGYFADRPALLTEMLDTWEDEMSSDLIERVESQGGDGRTRLRRLTEVAEAAAGPTADMALDLSIREWARRDDAVAQRLRRVDNRRMDYLRQLFRDFCPDEDEVEVRATIAFSLWIAEHLVDFDPASRTRKEVVELIDRRLFA